jgi:hypothetical protein
VTEHDWQHQPDCSGVARHPHTTGHGSRAARPDELCEDACWFHHRCEPTREHDYQLCTECWHVYRTKWELLAAYITNAPPECQPVKSLHPDDIAFCPLCLHDF